MAHSLLCTSHLSLLQRSAHAEQHIMQILKVELSSFWPPLSIDLGTCRVMCGEFNIPVLPLSLHHSSSSPTCPSSPLHGVFIFHLVCYFMFVFLLSFPAYPSSSSSSSHSPQIQPVVSRSSLATIPCGLSREEDTGSARSTKKGAFHEIFSLLESERPLAGEGSRCTTK